MKQDTSLIGELITAARIGRTKRSQMLAAHGLYAGQDTLLKSLEENDGQTMGSLAGNLGVRPPTVTKMVSRMAAQNLLERKTSTIDSRQSHVHLTKEGKKLLKKIDKIWRKADALALGDIKDKQEKQLTKALRKIATNLDDAAPVKRKK